MRPLTAREAGLLAFLALVVALDWVTVWGVGKLYEIAVESLKDGAP